MKAKEYLAKIDSLGGSVRAIEQNYFQTEIADSAYKYQRAIDEKEKKIVGVNEFVAEETAKEELLKVDESIRNEQIKNLTEVKQKRNNDAVKEALLCLKKSAQTNENLIPHILKSVEQYASIGEISDTLRVVWGVYE